jgi:uncharacterized delta-60 repeat protein
MKSISSTMQKMKSLKDLSFILLLLSYSAIAQPGTLDASFGNGGKVITDLSGKNDYGYTLAIQPDGKIIVGGSSDSNFALIRYNSDGFLDSTFGINGSVITDFNIASSPNNDARSVALQEDGKILLLGTVFGIFDAQLALVRYNINGSFDSSFGDNGKVISNFSGGWFGYSLAIQFDKKILVEAYVSHLNSFINSFGLLRYNYDGSTDSTFGTNGLAEIIPDHDIPAYCVGIEPDGKIVVGGFKQFELDNHLIGDSIMVIRYKKNGLRDSSFGLNSIALAYVNTPYPFGLSLAIQDDGKIVVSGFSYNGLNNSFAILRFDTTGYLDSSFATNGIRITKLSTFIDKSSNFDNAYCLAIQKDGLIIQGGTSKGVSDEDFALVRYDSNGNIDSSFGTNGIVITPVGNDKDYAFAIGLQTDNKIMLAGFSFNGIYYDFAIARYNSEGTVPIKLLFFKAVKHNKSVLLNWQTATENNNAYFAIERSNNGNSNFKEIGRVNSKGTSTQLQQYSFEDFSPLNGGNYYRLKQVDKDGHTIYTKTVLVDFSKIISIKLYPNPLKDILTIDGLTGNKTTVSIIDINGRTLAFISTTDVTYTWNIKSLPAGTYYLRTEADKKVTTKKFIKE